MHYDNFCYSSTPDWGVIFVPKAWLCLSITFVLLIWRNVFLCSSLKPKFYLLHIIICMIHLFINTISNPLNATERMCIVYTNKCQSKFGKIIYIYVYICAMHTRFCCKRHCIILRNENVRSFAATYVLTFCISFVL